MSNNYIFILYYCDESVPTFYDYFNTIEEAISEKTKIIQEFLEDVKADLEDEEKSDNEIREELIEYKKLKENSIVIEVCTNIDITKKIYINVDGNGYMRSRPFISNNEF